MAQHVCPPWVGYLLINPLRKFFENPEQLLKPYLREGMTVLEPGCGMGYFTLPLARMTGPSGKVIVVDLQAAMLAKVEKRARKAGLMERIECRLAGEDSLGIDDMENSVDFAAVLYVAHEVPDQQSFFSDISRAMKPGGRVLLAEPRNHVSEKAFESTIAVAELAGLHKNLQEQNGGTRIAEFSAD